MLTLTASAFLFDMDGTLVDSTAKVEQVWRAWCQRSGADLEHVMAIQHGARSEETIRQTAPHADTAIECAWIDAMESTDCEGIVEIPGAAALLQGLPQVCWTVATSAARATAVARLRHCGIAVPDTMLCAEDVAIGKPDPGVFREAARRVGHAAEHCLAFEDSPAGIMSALGAGCRVVQIGGTHPLHAEVAAVIPDFKAVSLHLVDGRLALQLHELLHAA